MLAQLLIFHTYLAMNIALQLNFYSTVGQVKEEIWIRNGFFQSYFPHQEYHAIIPGTIDFPGQTIIEQNLYNSNEELRNTDIYIQSNKQDYGQTIRAKLVDPYTFLVQYNSSRYSYIPRDQIQFVNNPRLDGMVLSVRLSDPTLTQTNMTYLTRGLSWTPRYEVMVIDDQSATLRGLADITNEHERSYDTANSQLVTGTIPLASSSSLRVPAVVDNQHVEFMASSYSGASPSISSEAEASNFGTYSYNITGAFRLLPKSIKTFPFLSTSIRFNYTLETTIYLSSGTSSGFFQRMMTIEPSDFLPAGTITFYLAPTGLTLGQSRLGDTAKNSQQRVSLSNDPDVKYQISNLITSVRQNPIYGQDLNVTVVLTNRKDKQAVSVTLTINSGYQNTTLMPGSCSSSNITIEQDPINRSLLIVRASIDAHSEEKCMFALKQSN